MKKKQFIEPSNKQLKKCYELEPEILNELFQEEKPEFYEKQICNEYNFTQILFLIRKAFQKQLYLYDQIFYIKIKYIKFEITCYFYLSMLIKDEPGIINYQYDFDLIISIDDNNKSSENSIQKVMISKIIIDLINNFKDLPDYNEEEYEQKLNIITEKNRRIIDENINKFKELKINLTTDAIIRMNIDDIYVNIIESIIASRKFDEITNIFTQLGLEVINIANIKYDELEKLAKNEKFKISQVQDLFNNEKINYYYILLKFIFKPNSYFNNITLFKGFRDFLIKILKTQLYELLSNYKDDEEINKKLKYIIENILNSGYYYNKYSKVIELIKFYYKNKSNKSKKDEIKSIELKFKNNNLNYSEYPLPLYEIKKFCELLFINTFTYEINIKNKYIFEEQYKVGNYNIIYEDKYIKYIKKKLCNESIKNDLDLTNIENDVKLFEILNNNREEINNKFKNKIKLCYNFTIKNKNSNQLYDIYCECNISGLIGNYKNNFKIEDVLNNGINIIDLISKKKTSHFIFI